MPMMIEVKLNVPDGELCVGCKWLSHQPHEVAYGFHKSVDTCLIFDTCISKVKKCEECLKLSGRKASEK